MGFPKLVRCVDNSGGYEDHLMEGKQYTIVKEDKNDWVYLKEDELGNTIAGYAKERFKPVDNALKDTEEEYTGASVSYYAAEVANPTNPDSGPYTAECNDLIEALGMTFAEGNAFKAIWRSCAARKLGKAKKGYDNGLYDAEKVVFFGERMIVSAKAATAAKAAKENGDVEGDR